MRIRRATASDVQAIAAVWNEEIRHGISTFNSVEKTTEEILQLIEQRGDALQVAYSGAVFLGFVTLFQFRGGVGYRHCAEHTLYLTSDARGRGVGRALMQRACEVARAKQFSNLVACISGENAAGLGFHTALGFVKVGQMPGVGFKFGRPMDLVLMQKRL